MTQAPSTAGGEGAFSCAKDGSYSDVVTAGIGAASDVLLQISRTTRTRGAADAIPELRVNDPTIFTFDVAELHKATGNGLQLIKGEFDVGHWCFVG